VGLIRDGAGRERYFVCNLGIGLTALVTVESRRIRRLQGLPLYGLAAVRVLWRHRVCPTWRIERDDMPAVEEPSLSYGVLVGQREGNFRMAPDARLDDGWLDYVHVRRLSRGVALWHLVRLVMAGRPADHPKIEWGRCRRVRITSEAPLCVHTDGELFCVPDEGVRSVEVSVLPSRLPVQLLHLGGSSGAARHIAARDSAE
jgi:diacylglycerol kinase family enzyme